ncbi:MAG: alpha/beta fold hydrolase [Planctomycetes bacterium]|nr:alpha/beta fold hydrolase [Planctomycetota bacterium]
MPVLDLDGMRIHYEESGAEQDAAATPSPCPLPKGEGNNGDGAPLSLPSPLRGEGKNGNSSGKPVVVGVHGWGASWKFWRGTMAALEKTHRVVALDLPGFAGSDKPEAPYTIEWFVEVVRRFCDRLGVERATFAGHSMGGMIVSQFALEHPSRVERLILACAPVQGRTAFFWKTRLLLAPVIRWIVYLLSKIHTLRRWLARDFSTRCPLDDDIIRDVGAASYASMFRTLQSLRATDGVPRFNEIRCPALVIGTDRDHLVTPEQFRLAAEHLPGARRVDILNAGHCPMFEAPEEFEGAIRAFLRETAPLTLTSPPAGERGTTDDRGHAPSSLPAVASLLLLALAVSGCATHPVARPSARRIAWREAGIERTISIGGRTVHYLETGEGPVILCLHGLGGSAYDWRAQLEPLAAAGFRVIAPDLLGAGYTDKPAGGPGTYSVASQATLVGQLCDALGVRDAVCLGNSYGGGVSLTLAFGRPECVRALVLCDPVCFRQELPSYVALLRAPVVARPLVRAVPEKIALYQILARIFADDRKIGEEALAEYVHEFALPGTKDALVLMARDLIPPNVGEFEDALPKVKQPALVLWGRQDDIIPLAQGERLVRTLPHARIEVLDPCGHAPNQERPEDVNRLTIEFVKSLPGK